MVVAVLTSASNGPLHVRRMPRSDTRNFAQTFVRLPRQLLCPPPARHTLETMTFRNRNAVNHLVLLEDGIDVDRLLKQSVPELNLVRRLAAVDLDLHQMSLLLLKRGLANLGVGQDADDGAVALDALELAGDGLGLLRVFLCVLGEGLLLRRVPVLVEPPLELVAQVLGPYGGEGAQAARCLNVAYKADNDHLELYKYPVELVEYNTHRRGINDGASLDDFLLVHFGARTVKVAYNGGHARLVAHGSCQMRLLLGVVLGEALDLAAVTRSSLPR